MRTNKISEKGNKSTVQLEKYNVFNHPNNQNNHTSNNKWRPNLSRTYEKNY